MHRIRRSQISPYSPEQWYGLVNDIQSYPEFIPNCSMARIIEQSDDGYVAEVEINFARLKQRFATRNTLQPHHEITMALAFGPFKNLNGAWVFEQTEDNGCQVHFELAYEFSSKRLGIVIGPLFDRFTDKAVSAFVSRAQVVYDGP